MVGRDVENMIANMTTPSEPKEAGEKVMVKRSWAIRNPSSDKPDLRTDHEALAYRCFDTLSPNTELRLIEVIERTERTEKDVTPVRHLNTRAE